MISIISDIVSFIESKDNRRDRKQAKQSGRVPPGLDTRRIQAILSDEEYRLLQAQLVQKPDAGKIIPGSGGLRKLRWSASGRGKRGGARVIYYWFVSPEVILMLFAYPKNERGDLTPDQLKQLKKIVEGELK